MHRFRRHLNYANVAATLALVIAVAGGTTAIAVSKGSKSNDINKKGNIRAGHVTTSKLANGNVTASKLAGIDVVQASTNTSAVTATCPDGERLLGGGAQDNGQPAGVSLAASAPSGNGWNARIDTASPASRLDVYALCLKTAPGS
jgi:hypothetical protein